MVVNSVQPKPATAHYRRAKMRMSLSRGRFILSSGSENCVGLPIIAIYEGRLQDQRNKAKIVSIASSNSIAHVIFVKYRKTFNVKGNIAVAVSILLLHQTRQGYQVKAWGKICKTSFSQMQSLSPHSFLL